MEELIQNSSPMKEINGENEENISILEDHLQLQ